MSDIKVSETLALVSQRLAEHMAQIRAGAIPEGVVMPEGVVGLDLDEAVEMLESSMTAIAAVIESLAVEREALLSLRAMVDLLVEAPEEPVGNDEELPGMWSHSDFTGGAQAAREADRARHQLSPVAHAYGLLWHANNGEDVPGFEFLTPERAAMQARLVLRDTLSPEDRGAGIVLVGQLLKQKPAEGSAHA